jgi:hypothetical protein
MIQRCGRLWKSIDIKRRHQTLKNLLSTGMKFTQTSLGRIFSQKVFALIFTLDIFIWNSFVKNPSSGRNCHGSVVFKNLFLCIGGLHVENKDVYDEILTYDLCKKLTYSQKTRFG